MTFDDEMIVHAQQYLRQVMHENGNNVSLAAAAAGRNRTNFYKLLLRYGVVNGARPVTVFNHKQSKSYVRHVTGTINKGNDEWQLL